MEFIAQAISIIAMIVSICSLQLKTNKGLFVCRGVSGFLFSLSYLLIGAYTGALLNLLNVLKSTLLVNKKTSKKPFMFLMIALYVGAAIVTFGGPLSILVGIAQCAETVVMWHRNGKHIRICQLGFLSPVWLIYNIVEFSLGGILTEIFVMGSTVVSFIRFRKTGFDKT